VRRRRAAQSTAVAQSFPDHLWGNGFGVLGLVQALGDMGSTVVAGALWSLVSPAVGFGYATAWMFRWVTTLRLLRR
jgi:hypothetical protein